MKIIDYATVVNKTRYLTVALPYYTMDAVPDFASMHATMIQDVRRHSPLLSQHEHYDFSQLQSVAEEYGYRHKLHQHQSLQPFAPYWNPVGYWLHLISELPKIHTLDILTEKNDRYMRDMMQSFMDFVHDFANGPRIHVRLHTYPWDLTSWLSDENKYHMLEHHEQRLVYTYHTPPNAAIFMTAMATLHQSPIAVAEHPNNHKRYWQWNFVNMSD